VPLKTTFKSARRGGTTLRTKSPTVFAPQPPALLSQPPAERLSQFWMFWHFSGHLSEACNRYGPKYQLKVQRKIHLWHVD